MSSMVSTNIPRTDTFHEVTIFLAILTDGLVAIYSKCVEFRGKFTQSRMMFPCDGDKGHVGNFLYIRDDTTDSNQLILCEVEVFGFRGGDQCGEPEIPVFGNVSIDSNGTTMFAVYSCDQGYMLHGEMSRHCMAGGVWSDHMPVCLEITCGYPDRYPHAYGRLTNRTSTINSTAEYFCHYGYMLSKESTKTMVVCQEDGTWDEPVFTCNRDPTIDLKLFDDDDERPGYRLNGSIDPFRFPLVTATLCIGVLVISSVAVACLIKRYYFKREIETPPIDNDDNSFEGCEETIITPEREPIPSSVPTISVGDRLFNELPPIIEAEEPIEMQSLDIPYVGEHKEIESDIKLSIPEVHTTAKKTLTWGENTCRMIPKSPTNEYCYRALQMRAEDTVMYDVETEDDNAIDERNAEVKVRWSLPSSVKSFFKLKKTLSGNEMRSQKHPENIAEMGGHADNFLGGAMEGDERFQYEECSGGSANPSADRVIPMNDFLLVAGNPDLCPGAPTEPAKPPKDRSNFAAF